MSTKVILVDIFETCPLLRHLFLISQQMTWEELDPCGWSYKHFMEIAFRLKHVSNTSRTFPVGCTPVLTTFKVTLIIYLIHHMEYSLQQRSVVGNTVVCAYVLSILQHEELYKGICEDGVRDGIKSSFLSVAFYFIHVCNVGSLGGLIVISGKMPQPSSSWGPDLGNANKNMGIYTAEIP